MISIPPGDAVILAGLMGARKTAFAVQYFLLNPKIPTITNIPLADGAGADNVYVENLGSVLHTADLNSRLVVWDEAGAWCQRAGVSGNAALASWLATIRHRQISVLFLCQSPGQLHRAMMELASRTLHIVNISARLGITKSSVVHAYFGYAYQHELRNPKHLSKLWTRRYKPSPDVYAAFDSVDFGDADRKHEIPGRAKFFMFAIPSSLALVAWFFLFGGGLDVFGISVFSDAPELEETAAAVSAPVREPQFSYICNDTPRCFRWAR